MSPDTVYFVQISDTHFGNSPDYARFGHTALPCAQRLVELINDLPTRPDFVIHTGDVVTDPDPRAYALAAETFAALEVPIYYVTGNHDSAADIRRYLPMGPKSECSDDPDVLSYSFDVKGHRFLVVDGRGPDSIDPHGVISPSQMATVRREAGPEGPPLTVFMHYPALPIDSRWMDANMLLLNGEELHQALLPARDRLRGVFYGHIHQTMQTYQDGILYVAAASAFAQLTAWPEEEMSSLDVDHLPGYNFVTVMADKTLVHQHTFPRL